MKLLLADPRVDPSDQNNQVFILTAQQGSAEDVKLLLSDSRIDPSDQDNQAFIEAAERRRRNFKSFISRS